MIAEPEICDSFGSSSLKIKESMHGSSLSSYKNGDSSSCQPLKHRKPSFEVNPFGLDRKPDYDVTFGLAQAQNGFGSAADLKDAGLIGESSGTHGSTESHNLEKPS